MKLMATKQIINNNTVKIFDINTINAQPTLKNNINNSTAQDNINFVSISYKENAYNKLSGVDKYYYRNNAYIKPILFIAKHMNNMY